MALIWAVRTLAKVRRRLPSEGPSLRIVPPRRFPEGVLPGVERALSRREATCLERSLIVQAFLASHQQPRDVVIAVATAGGFRAHAWVDGYDQPEWDVYRELTRLAPRHGRR